MARWTPVALAAFCAVIVLFGLGYVLEQTLTVAPWAHTAEQGRVHPHLKNVTRFGGDPDAVRRSVHRAAFLAEPDRPARDWRDEIRRQTRPRPDAEHIVVLPGGADDLAWALPGAYWAVRAGVPVAFVDPANPDAAVARVQAFRLPAVIAAPEDLVSEAVARDLASTVRTWRVAGDSPDDQALAVAQARIDDVGFGWGRTHDRRTGYFEYAVVAPKDAEAGLAGLPLARSNQAALLFAGDDGGVPAATDRYLWAQRTDWFVTPSEGPFRHLWVLGDTVSYASQARMDLALEKSPYASRGAVALGPFEALGIGYVALGLASGLFVLLHGLRLLPDVMLANRIAWAWTAALVPVVGALLYLAAYRRPRHVPDDMPRFERPAAIQAAAATAMGFGYGAPLMIVVGYLMVWYGFPIGFGEAYAGLEPALGAGMTRMMTAMFVVAVLVAWPLVQVPMKAMMMHASAAKVAWSALATTTVSMAAVGLGMMTLSWVLLMYHLPMMPKEDDILWFVSLWVASTLGFFVAWPLNAPMVRHGMKEGAA